MKRCDLCGLADCVRLKMNIRLCWACRHTPGINETLEVRQPVFDFRQRRQVLVRYDRRAMIEILQEVRTTWHKNRAAIIGN